MKKQLLKVFFGENLSKGLLLLVSLILINGMSVTAYAQFTKLFTLIMLGSQLACAAVERLYIADHENFRPYAARALWGCMAVCVVAVLGYLWDEITVLERMSVVGGLVFLSLFQYRRIIYQQSQSFSHYLLADILRNSCWLVAVVWFYFAHLEISALLATLLLSGATVVGLCVMPRVEPSQQHVNDKPSFMEVLSVMCKNADVYVYTLVAAVLPYMAVLMASHTSDSTLTATYGAAMRYQAIIATCIQVMNVVYLPKISEYVSRGESEQFLRSSLRAIPVLSVFVILVVIAIVLVIPYIDKGRYPDAPLVFSVLAGCSWMSMLAVSSVNYLLATKVYRPILVAMMLGLFAIVVGNFYLQGVFPVLGVALASLFGYMVINLFIIMKARKLSLVRCLSGESKVL